MAPQQSRCRNDRRVPVIGPVAVEIETLARIGPGSSALQEQSPHPTSTARAPSPAGVPWGVALDVVGV